MNSLPHLSGLRGCSPEEKLKELAPQVIARRRTETTQKLIITANGPGAVRQFGETIAAALEEQG